MGLGNRLFRGIEGFFFKRHQRRIRNVRTVRYGFKGKGKRGIALDEGWYKEDFWMGNIVKEQPLENNNIGGEKILS